MLSIPYALFSNNRPLFLGCLCWSMLELLITLRSNLELYLIVISVYYTRASRLCVKPLGRRRKEVPGWGLL